MIYDVIVVGAGPGGSVCAAFCVQAGLRTLVLEKANFPREKVCGDCLNPSCWPILERLGVADRVLALPHAKLAEVHFIGLRGLCVAFSLKGKNMRGEVAVKRSLFDQLLLQRAIECGAEARLGLCVTTIEQVANDERGWKIHAGSDVFESRTLVAADGRNSTVARLLGLLPRAEKDRVALQTHLIAPRDFDENAQRAPHVSLRFLPHGYCGFSNVGDGEINVCLVSRPPKIAALKTWAEAHFCIAKNQSWRTITPLSRRAISPAPALAGARGDSQTALQNLLLIGDAARVVEPFTGEGIYYALASGELAAKRLCGNLSLADFSKNHARLYDGRLWINRLARAAVLHPHAGSFALEWLHRCGALRAMTEKIVGEAAAASR